MSEGRNAVVGGVVALWLCDSVSGRFRDCAIGESVAWLLVIRGSVE